MEANERHEPFEERHLLCGNSQACGVDGVRSAGGPPRAGRHRMGTPTARSTALSRAKGPPVGCGAVVQAGSRQGRGSADTNSRRDLGPENGLTVAKVFIPKERFVEHWVRQPGEGPLPWDPLHYHAAFPLRSSTSSLPRTLSSTGLTRCASKPALSERRRSASWPQPVKATSTGFLSHCSSRILRAAS